ncbi:cytochrome C [Polymorphobacter arshaanensis]|uniref:Cytochrome C n=1 Tax=Glacieibacterium arshaanense TaxID=2511025 RepID=A0A4Y9EPT5_9SPHN|nr:cytochrome C [Polymorphobacter arshaanensis]TFU03791.1 cytochrome C [Polymorphobacter arshaanensis]
MIGLASTPAFAVPSFAIQTGQPCQSCHVGGFGPQLTLFGREFKIRGYTQRIGGFSNPLAAMVVVSGVHTKDDQAEPPAPALSLNNNIAIDQFSVFVAGGIGQHFGGFVQTTYDGVAKAWAWDNVDLRGVTSTMIGSTEVLFGTSVNNSPTVQDLWNTLTAWGFPYTDSGLAPGPAAAPLIAGGLAQTTVGVTGYAWINQSIYLEGGGYGSPKAGTLTWLGADPYAPGSISGIAPYARVAYQKVFGSQNIQIGAYGLWANMVPGRDTSTGLTDRYVDLGLDGSWQYTTGAGDMFTLNARYVHETQTLGASDMLGIASNYNNHLTDIRADASYYWRNHIGGTVQLFSTSGSADALLYGGSFTGSPNSAGATFQIDGTPFGASDSPSPYLNLRVGFQYTAYTKFDGAKTNYDGNGANASGNNTARVFAWFAF